MPQRYSKQFLRELSNFCQEQITPPYVATVFKIGCPFGLCNSFYTSALPVKNRRVVRKC